MNGQFNNKSQFLKRLDNNNKLLLIINVLYYSKLQIFYVINL